LKRTVLNPIVIPEEEKRKWKREIIKVAFKGKIYHLFLILSDSAPECYPVEISV
jgi:hypothetical protein